MRACTRAHGFVCTRCIRNFVLSSLNFDFRSSIFKIPFVLQSRIYKMLFVILYCHHEISTFDPVLTRCLLSLFRVVIIKIRLTIMYIRDAVSYFRIAITKFQLWILYLQDALTLFRVVITKFNLSITLIRDVFCRNVIIIIFFCIPDPITLP